MMYKIIGLMLILTINNTFSYSSTIKPINCPKYCECNEFIQINAHLFNIYQHNHQPSTVINTNKHHNQHNLMLNVKCINTDYLIKLQNKNIYKLDISNINIKKFNLNIINNLYNLQILNISYNSIVDLSNTITLTQLTHIYLQYNSISTISYKFLPQSIHYIDISYNNLKYIPENFINLNKLQYLNLKGNPLLCTCFNYNSINELLKRLIIVDHDPYCNDTLTWDQFNKNVQCSIEAILNDAEGSGDVESTVDAVDHKSQDFNNMIESSSDRNNFEDEELIPVHTESTTRKSTTVKSDDLIISEKNITDFYFNDTNKSSYEEESGSGDDQQGMSTMDSDDLIVPMLNSTSDEITEYNMTDYDTDLSSTTSEETIDLASESTPSYNQTEKLPGDSSTEEDDDDDDYGSGSGSGAIDSNGDFDYNFIDSSSTTERNEEVPIVYVNEPSTTTQATPSTEAIPEMPSTEAVAPIQPTSTTTELTSTSEKSMVEEAPIVRVETNLNEKMRTLDDSTDKNINEELGQVVKEANTSPSVGTYAFLTILVIVLIALIGYTVIKRRVNHQNQRNNNNQQLAAGRNGGTPDATGNNGLKKKSLDDVDNDKYGHEMINMRNKDDEKKVALLNQENELRKPKNGSVVNEKSPMMNDPDDSHIDNQLSVPTTSAETPTTPIPSPRNLDPANGNGAVEKVKITMTELTDSIPKTPVLVTRTKSFTKDGPQIIVTPNLNQRPNLQK